MFQGLIYFDQVLNVESCLQMGHPALWQCAGLLAYWTADAVAAGVTLPEGYSLQALPAVGVQAREDLGLRVALEADRTCQLFFKFAKRFFCHVCRL